MKLWQLIFLIFLTNNVSAFFVFSEGDEAVSLPVEKTIHIEINDAIAHVEMTTEFHNPTQEEIVFQEIEPITEGATV